jgi:hypothetical protein
MEIVVLSPVDVDVNEKDIQSALERNLGFLDEGLEFIGSEIVIGTGRIDTLAYDSINGRPVFIEYKGPSAFGRDALIQLMEYLAWFSRDENRITMLERIIRQRKPEIQEIKPSILLICVAADIEDRIRNAIYVLANDVKVFTYLIARDTAGKLVLVPKLEVDNTDVEGRVPEAISENDLLSKHPHLQDLFRKLRGLLEKDGTSSYTTSKSFRFKKGRVFAKLRFRKRYIQLELRVGRGGVVDPDFKYWRGGESSWGYVFLYPSNPLPDKVVAWIDRARNLATQSAAGDEEDEAAESQ